MTRVGMGRTAVAVRLLRPTLRAPFATSFGTYRELTRPFVVLRTEDGLVGVGEISTLPDPAYKAECDTPAVLTSLREFVLPAVAHRQAAHGPIGDVAGLRASTAWIEGANFAIKPPRVGGSSEAIAIADFCRREGVRTWIGGLLDSARGKAFNLNPNALEAIDDLPGDHFSSTGAYFAEDMVATPLAATSGEHVLGEGVSTGVAFDWERFERLGETVFERRLDR